jgi:gluconate 2-dehydrogenase gamma chain
MAQGGTGTGISRRDILRTLAVGATVESVLRVIPLQAAEYAHAMVEQAKSAAAGKYAPKYFSEPQYATLRALCQIIIPGDEKSAGAIEAGAPEFIDLLTSENEEYQAKLGGGLMWLEHYCDEHYDRAFLACTPEQQKEVVDLMAFRKNAEKDPSLSQGVAFFSFLRDMTCDGFYTSKIGIADLGYIGNTSLTEFPGCPPLDKT